MDENLVAETQKKWLRKPHQERWHLEELNPEQRQFVLNWAQKQGIYSERKPAAKVYDKALILGGVTPSMERRLGYLKELWDQGVRCKEIVWLTGQRPLDSRVDDYISRCQTESEAASLLWTEADLLPQMRSLPVAFVALPMKRVGETLKRPTTEDTIVSWVQSLGQAEKSCRALFISDQPFCGYQFAVINSCLPKEIQFDVVGPSFDPTLLDAAAAVTLDAIARWIYQENLPKLYT